MAFEIHPRLAAGGFEIGRISGCRLLLKDNSIFPWFLLVPEVEGIDGLHQLPAATYDDVMTASAAARDFLGL